MTVHLRKLAVGIETVEHLEAVQAQKYKDYGFLFTHTRNTPKRKEELLEGGCLYWVIKGQFRGRQEIIGFEEDVDGEGRKYCLLLLKPDLVKTELKAQKPFQGWRYLEAKDAPQDLGEQPQGAEELPEHMQAELRELGLM